MHSSEVLQHTALPTLTAASLLNHFFERGRLFGVTVFEAGAGGQTVSLPVASVLAIVTAALCAGVDPSGLPRRNHLGARCIHVAVGTWGGGG